MENQNFHGDSNTLRAQFPFIQHLTIHLKYQSKEGVILDDQHREFHPDDPVDLSALCAGRCGTGQVDLAQKVNAMVENRETRGTGRALCQEPISSGADETCGCELNCQLKIQFRESK